MKTFAALALLAVSACTAPSETPSPVTVRDAGDVVVVVIDAGDDPVDAATPDASGPADVGFVDAGAVEPTDAGSVDAGIGEPVDAGFVDVDVVTSRPHWKTAFFDDFRGKTGAADDAYCFDSLKAQCSVWPGGSNDCDLGDVSGAGFYPPTKANLAAALRLANTSRDWNAAPEADVRAAYADLVKTRWKHVNKCTWNGYQMLNWMATDYAGKWSARFDPTLVNVDPAGKGHLELTAAYAPVAADCAFGGQSFGGVNCQLHAFPAGVLKAGVTYTVDTNPDWPGVYTAQIGGQCPNGGTPFGPNCRLHTFPPHVLERSGVRYWVDTDPQWPGVYYANTPYACRDNIDYSPDLAFRNLTCPILNGGMFSMHTATHPFVDAAGVSRKRGQTQFRGRFETKARIPKGVGAFPAVWLMPTEGGWPYAGGEIDIIEARDNADEVYQTYHHGNCYRPNTLEILPVPGPGECGTAGGSSMQLSKGLTIRQRSPDEFWRRDHLFAVEWNDQRFDYFVNGVKTHTINVGTPAQSTNPADAPASLRTIQARNFPTAPFYWILNHSTYVAPAAQASFARQVFSIDYVKSSTQCTKLSEFCPCGGRFHEGVGCTWEGGPSLACPAGVTLPPLVGDTYPAFCAPITGDCIHGGTRDGTKCVLTPFNTGDLRAGVTYWVDADPRWPGVYYAKVSGGCPYGGSGTVNCQAKALPADLVETGVDYSVDPRPGKESITYNADFAP